MPRQSKSNPRPTPPGVCTRTAPKQFAVLVFHSRFLASQTSTAKKYAQVKRQGEVIAGCHNSYGNLRTGDADCCAFGRQRYTFARRQRALPDPISVAPHSQQGRRTLEEPPLRVIEWDRSMNASVCFGGVDPTAGNFTARDGTATLRLRTRSRVRAHNIALRAWCISSQSTRNTIRGVRHHRGTGTRHTLHQNQEV